MGIIKNRSQLNLDKSNQRGTKVGCSLVVPSLEMIKTKICKRNVLALYLNHHYSENKITLFPCFAKTTNPFLFMFLFTEYTSIVNTESHKMNRKQKRVFDLLSFKKEFLGGVQLGS